MLVPLGIAEGGMGRAMEDRMFAGASAGCDLGVATSGLPRANGWTELSGGVASG